MNRKIQKNIKEKGLTLIEMIVVVAIFAILTMIIVFNYGEFNSRTVVTNTAYEIALTAREAQTFGLGVRGIESSGDIAFDRAYGIFVDLESDSAPGDATKELILFADTEVDDNFCKSGSSHCTCADDECIEKLELGYGLTISNAQLLNGGSCNTQKQIAVSFKRPNPDAVIKNQEEQNAVEYDYAVLTIESPKGTKMYVVLSESGQISVVDADGVPSPCDS